MIAITAMTGHSKLNEALEVVEVRYIGAFPMNVCICKNTEN